MRILAFSILILVILGAGAFAYWKLHHQPEPVHLEAPHTNPPAGASNPPVAFAGHTGPVRSVAFSPDGATLASTSDDSTVRLWDLATGTQRQVQTIEGGPVTAVAFSPDAKWIAAGRYDSKTATTIYLDAFDGSRIGATARTFRDASDLVSTVTFSQDGKLLLASVGPKANLWEVDSGVLKARLETGPNSSSAISPDGKTVLTGSTNENELKCWSVETGLLLRNWEGHQAGPTSIQYSPDGSLAVSAGYDAKAILWDTAAGTPARSMAVPDGDTVFALRFSKDGRRVHGALLHQVVIWNVAGGALERTIPFEQPHALAVSPDGTRLAMGGEHGDILVLDVTK